MTPTTSSRDGRTGRPRSLPHVAALDGVRGLAALAVVLHHGLATSAEAAHIRLSPPVLAWFVAQLDLGVDLFFVLSGCLITLLLLMARRRPNYYHDFYWKRVFRILPALVLVLAITTPVFHLPWRGVVAALFFVANFDLLLRLPDVGPYWTLSIEEQFYLLWPTVVRRARPRLILWVVVALIVLPVLLRLLGGLTGHNNAHLTPLHCDGLAWGALVALLCYARRIPFRPRGAARLWRQAGIWMVAGGLVLLVAALAVRGPRGRFFGMVLTAVGPLFAGVLLFLLTHPRGRLARVLSAPPLRFLGDISYMLYLCHTFWMAAYDALDRHWRAHPTQAHLYLRLLIVAAVSIAWSALSLFLYERPIGRLRRFVLRRA